MRYYFNYGMKSRIVYVVVLKEENIYKVDIFGVYDFKIDWLLII